MTLRILRGPLPCAMAIATMAAPATAQIQVLNPFGNKQGSVQQLVTASAAAYPCTTPASGSTSVSWLGKKFKMANGRAWNGATPYAVCLGSSNDYARFELRDTSNDHGPNDASTKRRAEIGNNADYRNGVTYWMAYSVRVHVDGLNKSLGNTMDQFQDPEGSSPSISHRLVNCSSPGGACLNTTTRYNQDGAGGKTVSRGQVPFALDTTHDLVMQFQMGKNGFQKTWLDGKLVSDYQGPIGSAVKDSYGLRIGTYGAPLSGMTIVQEYRNIAPFPSTASLDKRIASKPAW